MVRQFTVLAPFRHIDLLIIFPVHLTTMTDMVTMGSIIRDGEFVHV